MGRFWRGSSLSLAIGLRRAASGASFFKLKPKRVVTRRKPRVAAVTAIPAASQRQTVLPEELPGDV